MQALLPIVYENGTETRGPTARPAKPALVSKNVSDISMVLDRQHYRIREFDQGLVVHLALWKVCHSFAVAGARPEEPVRQSMHKIKVRTRRNKTILASALCGLPPSHYRHGVRTLRNNQLVIRTDYLGSNAGWRGQRVAIQQRLALMSDMQVYHYFAALFGLPSPKYADQLSNSAVLGKRYTKLDLLVYSTKQVHSVM